LNFRAKSAFYGVFSRHEIRSHALLFGHFQSTIFADIRRFFTTFVYKRLVLVCTNAQQISEFHNIEIQIHLKMDFAAEKIMMGQEFFDRTLLAEGLAHIAENIFDQFDGETLANCESVCESWRQYFIIKQLWKRRYLQKLAKSGTDAHRLIQSNPKLFQYFDQADQGTFHILYF
jgi:hypothetical protein